MNTTVFSFITSLLWCNIFTIVTYVLLRRKRFIIDFGIYSVAFLMTLSLLRLIINVEFPFTLIVHSYTIFPAVISFFEWTPFRGISDALDFRVADILVAIWIIGSFYLLYKIVLNEWRFKKRMAHEKVTQDQRIYSIMNQVSDGKSSKVRLIVTSVIDIPMIAGLLRPTIYLPPIPLSDKDIYNILSHEWTHYIHKDVWTKYIVQIICAIFWWNPLIYLLKYDFNNTLEIKSDLSITNNMTEDKKLEYLQSILQVAKSIKANSIPSPSTGIGLIHTYREHPLKQRFDLVLRYMPPNHRRKHNTILLITLMSFLFVSSYFIVLQPDGGPPAEYTSGLVFDIDIDNTFLRMNPDGTYSVYENDIFIGTINNADEEPFSSFQILETTEE